MKYIKKTEIEYVEFEDNIVSCNLETNVMSIEPKEILEEKEIIESDNIYNKIYYEIVNDGRFTKYWIWKGALIGCDFDINNLESCRVMFTSAGETIICSVIAGTNLDEIKSKVHSIECIKDKEIIFTAII